MARIIECVPNISEGRRPEVVAEAVAALRAIPGLRVLDVQSDQDHNRSVLTLVGEEASLKAGILALFEVATARIDLRSHQGEHPRLGAVDVVPFIPIEGASMTDCVALARDVGAAVAERFGVPIFLYEEAATRAPSQEPRRRAAGPVRGPGLEDEGRGLGPGFRTNGPARLGGGRRSGRPHAPHRLQRQPRDGRRRDREEDREGHPPLERRLPLRQGHGDHARGPRA